MNRKSNGNYSPQLRNLLEKSALPSIGGTILAVLGLLLSHSVDLSRLEQRVSGIESVDAGAGFAIAENETAIHAMQRTCFETWLEFESRLSNLEALATYRSGRANGWEYDRGQDRASP